MLFSAVVVEGVGGLGSEECLFLHFIEFENEFPSPKAGIDGGIDH
jgi:hypothetical protein